MTDHHRSRTAALRHLADGDNRFDVIVVGGGITGAGIAREAAGSGLRTLLVEQRDFAWGTSSRSSKMVHGGLRYLGSGQYRLTRDAVRERQRLLVEAPGLVEPLPFVMPHFRKQFPGPRLFGALLWLYDLIAGKRTRRRLTAAETLQWVPGLAPTGLTAGSVFTDAVTDDARLVQRTLEEASHDGAVCINYLQVREVLREHGQARGVILADQAQADANPTEYSAHGKVVINATGVWASQLLDSEKRIRPLRGSHLVLARSALPVSCSVSLLHPDDGRPVFAFPWHGATVLGTTDLDHHTPLLKEPRITGPEVAYLLKIAATLFPGRPIGANDILSSWAGVRPVVSSGDDKSPSRENREHVIWDEGGLVTVAGGKLTTFRLIAREVLERSRPYLDCPALRPDQQPVFSASPPRQRPSGISHQTWRRLSGFYGPQLDEVLQAGPTEPVATTNTLWAEVVWAAAHTDVVHLDDLMLRRTRLGLILPDGGQAILPRLHNLCAPVLGWDDARWQTEVKRYQALWQSAYAPPPSAGDAESAGGDA
ncbi:MAG: glycerol-3-phosphate dehydrogenase/oxidase [Marinobacter sp.]|uniref:glycerol-3-phosphate dehydrogenase/oxidase n=1 Tax=Marinobacter sp. TaxID=50741 RepID=UPI00299EFF3E|nr:glycerol-3-phosphate dehydrogenase/oxidase [Marinobacter sp.]MDX1755565.1 glycerol-3-phosphate dehydrogenase/oxidase [Marinobacter sp.]